MITQFTEENFLDFKCPYCGQTNSYPQDCIGHVRECMNCMESLIVPASDGEFGKKIPIPIPTRWLILRRLDASDWKDLLEFKFDNEEEASGWLENDRKLKLTTADGTFSLGVQVRDSGKIIGCVGLKFMDLEFLQAEVFVEGNQNGQYKDFAKEAFTAALGFCFNGLKMHRLIARCGNNDIEDCQLFDAVGMRREGEFVKHYRYDGEWLNTVWFAMLAEEYCAAGI